MKMAANAKITKPMAKLIPLQVPICKTSGVESLDSKTTMVSLRAIVSY